MLLDTNVLLRFANASDPRHVAAVSAIRKHATKGVELVVNPQVLTEFWVVATRPVAENGLGLSPKLAQKEIERIRSAFRFLPDSPDAHFEWERLVVEHQVRGKPAHDARLVAWMIVVGVKAILSFDRSDFTRYSEIQALEP